MSTTIEQGATPNATETVTVTPAQANPASATPAIQPDTAAEIADLKSRLASSDARIRELNKENQGHRIKAEEATTTLAAKEAEIADLLKRGKPADLLKALDERDALIAEKTEAQTKAERAKTLNEVAKALDLPEEGKVALVGLDRPNLVYEIKEEKKGNVTEKVVLVDGKPFDEAFKPFLPALRPTVAPRRGAGPAPVPAPSNRQTPIVRKTMGIF